MRRRASPRAPERQGGSGRAPDRRTAPRAPHIACAAKTHHVEADIGRVLVAVAHPQAEGVVAPTAAANHILPRIAVGARGPLPDIAGHVVKAEGRDAGGIGADRRGFVIAVGHVRRAALVGAIVGAPHAALVRRRLAPGKDPSVRAARGELPLLLARQPKTMVTAEGAGVPPTHLDHGMVVEADRIRGGPAAMTPIGTGHLDPASGPDVAEAAAFRIGDVAGSRHEGSELGVRDLEAHEAEGRHRRRPGRLVHAAVGIARLEFAGGDIDHLQRGCSLSRRDRRRGRRQRNQGCSEATPVSRSDVRHAPLPSPQSAGRSTADCTRRPRRRLSQPLAPDTPTSVKAVVMERGLPATGTGR